jgi:hypothetical protein
MLEQLFGVARTLVGAQRNFDTLQFEERFSTIVAMFFIYLQFPSWKEHARRLSESCDHWNTRSWTGDVDPRKVNLVNAWATGFRISYGKLLATGLLTATDLDIDAILAKDKTISLIYPKGTKEPLIINDANDDAPGDITGTAAENANAPASPSEPEPGGDANMDLDDASAATASTAAEPTTDAPMTAAPTDVLLAAASATAAPTALTTTEDVRQTLRTCLVVLSVAPGSCLLSAGMCCVCIVIRRTRRSLMLSDLTAQTSRIRWVTMKPRSLARCLLISFILTVTRWLARRRGLRAS